MHTIAPRLLSVHVGDSSRCSEEIVKSQIAPFNAIIIIIIILLLSLKKDFYNVQDVYLVNSSFVPLVSFQEMVGGKKMPFINHFQLSLI